ncbi:MAG: hypothetical protein KC731_30185, partial [Myxococcales bacterium]|nr:hypothetical protein [Myxococcales bacterium]
GRSPVEQALVALGGFVQEAATTVMVNEADRRLAIRQLARHEEVQLLTQPVDAGSAVATLVPLIDHLVADPAATVVIFPTHQVIAASAALDRALAAAERAAQEHRTVVLLGAESDRLPSEGGWLLAHGAPKPPHRASVYPLARWFPETEAAVVPKLVEAGAVRATGIVVAHGLALLELFEELTPRLLRLFLYGAGLPPAKSEAFAARAYHDLGSLDLVGDLLSMGRGLHLSVLPREVVVNDLRGELRLAAWLASQGAVRGLASTRARGYRRVAAPA